MATVQEIAARIAREAGDDTAVIEKPRHKAGWEESASELMQKNPDGTTSYKPNRKVWAAAVAGLVAVASAYLSQTQGYELDEAGTTAVTMALMTLVAYFVPEA